MEIGELVRVALSYSHPNGSVAQNVFLYELVTAAATDAAVVTAIDDWVTTDWGPDWETLGNDLCVLFQSDIDIINTDGTVDRNIGQETYNIAGNEAGESLSPAVSCYMQATTALAKVLGKKYVPYIGSSVINEGLLSSGAVAAMVLLFAEYILDLTPAGGGTLEAGVLSRTAQVFRKFNGGGSVTDVPAYQRRRKPGVGS